MHAAAPIILRSITMSSSLPLFRSPSWQASMWQLTFAVNPKVLSDIDYSLGIDDRVLRWAVLKRQHLARLPNPYRIANAAKAVASTASPQR